MSAKDLFEKEPTPIFRLRTFHGQKLPVWEGKVKFNRVSGWVDNPRIRLACKKKKTLIGDRELTQDEAHEIMKMDPEVKLGVLRDDILQNGLREPIVLSSTGRLLDGNRRYFAIRYLLEGMAKGNPERSAFEIIPAYVLDDICTKEQEEFVLVEENFHASLKIEWPDYIKALFIKEDLDNGLKPAEIAKKYGWDKSKVGGTVKILQIIDDFIAYATAPRDPGDEFGGGLGLTEGQAETIAAGNYQFFNEAQKSFLSPLQTEADFKVAFFRWLAEGKFASFQEVRVTHDVWLDPEAKAALQSADPSAAKDAKSIIEYKKRVLKGKGDARLRIEEFTKYLASLKADQMKEMPSDCLKNLREALALVTRLVDAAREIKVQEPNEN